jgi:hypothetical protein
MSTPAFITPTSGEATVLGYKKKKGSIHAYMVVLCGHQSCARQNKTKQKETRRLEKSPKIVLRDAASTILKLIPS